MTASEDPVLPGDIFDETMVLSVEELSRMCRVEQRHIMEFVQEGVLEAVAVSGAEWRFSGAALRRARTALRLQRDLEINLAGVALVLELLDELEQLRRELDARR